MGVSKPCPFCGSHDTTAVWDRAGDDPFFVRLPGACEVLVRVRCDADVVFYSTVTLDVGLEQDEAVSELWNRRAAREEARDE